MGQERSSHINFWPPKHPFGRDYLENGSLERFVNNNLRLARRELSKNVRFGVVAAGAFPVMSNMFHFGYFLSIVNFKAL